MKIELDGMTIEGTPKEFAEYLRLISVDEREDAPHVRSEKRDDASAPVGVKSIQEQADDRLKSKYAESLMREAQVALGKVLNPHVLKYYY